jgi:predicted SAM-dependent methyltransferase
MGLDLGFGGDPITRSAIAVDLHKPYTNLGDSPQHLWGDARNLYWFTNGCLDYVYSSHLLEDFPENETLSIVNEWLRVLKPGGVLVLNLPNEQIYRNYCEKAGQPINKSHSNCSISLEWFISNILSKLTGVSAIYSRDYMGSYSFEIVLRKD